MALAKAKYSEIPKDGIILSETEALELQTKFFKDWRPKSEVFPVIYGNGICAAANCVVGMYINSHYRHKFRLLYYGRFSTYFPIVIVPAFLSIMLQTQYVLKDVLLQASCPICIEIRSASIQAFSGLVLPACMAPLATIPVSIILLNYGMNISAG